MIDENSKKIYFYVSTKAACDPVRTIYLCAPARDAASLEGVERFAKASGWIDIAQEQGAVLVVPTAEHGWEAEPPSLLLDLYNKTRNSFKTRGKSAIWGREGKLWCWETILYIVGYKEGAIFAGNFVTAHPNFAAAAALVDGLPENFEAGDWPSDHWLVRTVSEDYSVRNRDIPVCLWLFGAEPEAARPVMDYFGRGRKAIPQMLGTIETTVCRNEENHAAQVRLVTGEFTAEEERSRFIFSEEFARMIRWKNGPDGTLALIDSREEFYADPRFVRQTVEMNGNAYDYFVHLPAGREPEQVKGLPVVFTVHGRGEPAWMFTVKNGWDTLSDETGEFILVSPDSPGNIWFIQRDGDVFAKIIDELAEKYGIDTERVYLTGFSNGAVMTREMAWYRPDLFAGISPSNGPWFDTRSMQLTDTSRPPQMISSETETLMENFAREDWEMPCVFFYGDNDPAAVPQEDTVPALMLTANRCADTPARIYTADNYFTKEKGYVEGDRFKTSVYCDEKGSARVFVTIMKNMPHGAIRDESRFAWECLKRFRRPKGCREVQILSDMPGIVF